jgi:hypothetical protein
MLLLSDITKKQTLDAITRCGLTENDLKNFENIEQLRRYIHLENKKRSNERNKEKQYFKKYYEANKEKMKEASRVQKQKIRMKKIEESIMKKIET